jgi:hypothetical protein
MIYIERLYGELRKERDLRLPKFTTSPFGIFNNNIARALMLPTLRYGPETDRDWATTDTAFLHQAAIAQIVTSLEVYYELVFRGLSSNLKLSEINPAVLARFIRGNRLGNELLSAIEEKATVNVRLSDVIPWYFSFQQKDRIKDAMALVELDPITSYGAEWERTFGNKEDSTSQLRHAFVHGGTDIVTVIRLLVKEDAFVINRIKDAIVLAANLETQIHEKYPRNKELFPMRSGSK